MTMEMDNRLRSAKTISNRTGDSFSSLLVDIYSEDLNLRMQAVNSLGASGDSRAIGPLLEMLGCEEIEVQLQAVEALGRLRDAQAVPTLVELLGNESWWMRSQ